MTAFLKTAESYTPGAQTLPRRYFTSREIFAEEMARIFAQRWICAGHQSQLAAPGDFFVQNVAGESLILLRDRGGEIRGFYNLCRHRGTRLCEKAAGRFHDSIQCSYHAWTYSLDGRLIGAPHMNQIAGFDKAQYPLHAVSLALWKGFIFVNLQPDPEPFATAFAPLLDKFAHWNLPKLRSAKRIEYEVRANWKLIFENFSECYHCPPVHPMLSKLVPYDAAENDLYEGPFLGGFMPIPKAGSVTTSGNLCALPLGDRDAEDHRRAFYYSIFPNLLLNMHPDYVLAHLVWPQAPDRALVCSDWFFHPEAFERADFNPSDAIDFWDMTNWQDWHVCELSQQGISSRMYRPGPYSSRESIPAAFDREYLRVLEEGSKT